MANVGSFTGQPCLIIAEVAQAHDGSLGMAHSFIDTIADAGANAVKFQTHLAESESTLRESWRVPFSRQDKTRYEYWKRVSFRPEEWAGLAEHAATRGLKFLSSAFCSEAVDLLNAVGVDYWKVASGEVTNLPLLERMLLNPRPVIFSSGLSSLQELSEATSLATLAGVDYAVLQCTSKYPCPPEKIGLNVLSEIKDKLNCPFGLSDHSGTIFPSLAAVSLGAKIVEVHVTMSREMFGPDTPSSITTAELRTMCEGIRFIEKALSNPVDKGVLDKEDLGLKKLFGKSIVARMSVPRGTLISVDHLAFKKPGGGLEPKQRELVLGKRTNKDLHPDDEIRLEDLVP